MLGDVAWRSHHHAAGRPRRRVARHGGTRSFRGEARALARRRSDLRRAAGAAIPAQARARARRGHRSHPADLGALGSEAHPVARVRRAGAPLANSGAAACPADWSVQMAGISGIWSKASGDIPTANAGSAAAPTIPASIPSWSIRGTQTTSASACPAAVSGPRAPAADLLRAVWLDGRPPFAVTAEPVLPYAPSCEPLDVRAVRRPSALIGLTM